VPGPADQIVLLGLIRLPDSYRDLPISPKEFLLEWGNAKSRKSSVNKVQPNLATFVFATDLLKLQD
jgi:hypothetical protein